jgi:hypothetical protein
MVILLVLLVEEKRFGYEYPAWLCWLKRNVRGNDYTFLVLFCWLKRKVWDGYYGYAG